MPKCMYIVYQIFMLNVIFINKNRVNATFKVDILQTRKRVKKVTSYEI